MQNKSIVGVLNSVMNAPQRVISALLLVCVKITSK